MAPAPSTPDDPVEVRPRAGRRRLPPDVDGRLAAPQRAEELTGLDRTGSRHRRGRRHCSDKCGLGRRTQHPCSSGPRSSRVQGRRLAGNRACWACNRRPRNARCHLQRRGTPCLVWGPSNPGGPLLSIALLELKYTDGRPTLEESRTRNAHRHTDTIRIERSTRRLAGRCTLGLPRSPPGRDSWRALRQPPRCYPHRTQTLRATTRPAPDSPLACASRSSITVRA